MNFLTAFHTDVGIRKKTNQDSLLIHQAQTDSGNVLLAVICDGMGGLAKGEVASACMIRAFSDWFRLELPGMLSAGLQPEALRTSWEQLVSSVNQRITDYSDRNNVTMGTTCVALLIINETYYIMNIGDSRIYLISDNIYQLTKDQTYVQREMDAGRMTYEESLTDPQRSVLLQCVGASAVIEPDFFMGEVKINQCYMLCCDGFRHVIGAQEFFDVLNPSVNTDAGVMQQNLVYLTELNKQRNEVDNITAALIRTY
ncbi:MAG: serine/threonine-protein phosphatase [Oscillospiraceae bacterium]|nr:serine/threonine-protein phosphatase [Oscillospiraceae bacterium]